MSLSLGDSRFSDVPRQDQVVTDFSVADIVAATKNEVPFIVPYALTFDKDLGQGTTFRVTRELYNNAGRTPYYVAVKRFVAVRDVPNNPRKRYAGVLRELRVLTHPPLRSHGCIAQVIAYGWTENQSHGLQPYLVMDYSENGTVVQYLKLRSIPLHERRELALDVAAALKAVHECGIVHGDIKAENVLMFDNNSPVDPDDEYILRPQVARLADFSCTVFEQDFINQSEVYYLGTQTYNAPEIAGRSVCRYTSIKQTFDLFKLADCYSFGLLLWEVINNGRPYHDSAALRPGEKVNDFLDRISGDGQDTLCGLALSFCDTLEEVKANPEIADAVKKTLSSCLRDDPFQRCTMDEALTFLADGISAKRTQLVHPLGKSLPPDLPAAPEGQELATRQPGQAFSYTLAPVTSENLTVRQIIENDWPVVGTSDPVVFTETETDTGAFAYVDLDMFKTAMDESPPPNTQRDLANQIREAIGHQNDKAKKARLHLQLAVVYHIGYGLEPDNSLVLHHLRAASDADSVAKALFPAVSQALGMHCDGTGNEQNIESSSSPYLPLKPSYSSASRAQDDLDTHNLSSMLSTLQINPRSSLQAISNPNVNDTMLTEALTMACRMADFDTAKLIVHSCTSLSTEPGKPNPLHWLVMFNGHQAHELLETICQRNAGRLSLLAQDSGPPVYFPHQCMELFGTPLHWATRTGNLELVSLLIKHGADANMRCKARTTGASIVPIRKDQPNFSPLDLAVAYHFPDIVKILLHADSPVSGGSKDWEYTPFHLIGMRTMPFARLVAHRNQCRFAVRNTILALKSHGLDINVVDSESDTPLTLAVGSVDVEPYILEELLRAGATTCREFDDLFGNVVVCASRLCSDRLCSGWKTRLLLPLVEDLDTLDPHGLSALHYCALLGGASTARVLLDTGRVDTTKRSSRGHTALTYAALSGSASVIECLVEAKADLELPDRVGDTALAGAVSGRKLEASVALIRAGAKLSWEKLNILHSAVTNASQRGSIVRELLEECPKQLCIPALLDGLDQLGWTPMHRGAYNGDVDGVEALLDAGADHLTCKLPPYLSMGGTVLQLVIKTIERLKKGGAIAQDHRAVKGKGPVAVKQFIDRLDAIKGILEAR